MASFNQAKIEIDKQPGMTRREFNNIAATFGLVVGLGLSAEAEAKKVSDLVTVTLNYKTILGNDPQRDEQAAYFATLSELAQVAGYLAGDNPLSVPEDAMIKLVKSESISVTIDRNKLKKQKYTRVLSESKPRWDERQQAFITHQKLTLDFPRYLVRNDPILHQLAQTVTQGYSTLEEKTQALLCFVQTGIKYNFDNSRKPDFLRDPRQTLLDQTGDCKDTSVLYANLVQALGINPVFLLYDGHVNVGVPVDLESHPLAGEPELSPDGKVIFQNKTYYIAETTPEEPVYLGKIMLAQQGKKIDYILSV